MKAPSFQYPLLLTTILVNTITSPVSAFSSIAPQQQQQAGRNGNGVVPEVGGAESNDDNISAKQRQVTSTSSKRLPSTKQTPLSSATATTSEQISSWRLVLDIGREPLVTTSPIPFDWGRSGCRMPLVIPVDFMASQDNDNNVVVPRSDTVSFTGENGAVTSPVYGGTWNVVDSTKGKNSNGNDDYTKPKSLSFSLYFPESFSRRDIVIESDTTITLDGLFYTKSALDQLNDDFYQAREETWELGKELNDITRRNEAPKKWNESKQRWEKRYPTENLMTQVTKRMQLLKAQTNQKLKNSLRPNLNTLSSTFGTLPGVVMKKSDGKDNIEKEPIYMQKQGTVKIGNSVIGRWSAEPIQELRY